MLFDKKYIALKCFRIEHKGKKGGNWNSMIYFHIGQGSNGTYFGFRSFSNHSLQIGRDCLLFPEACLDLQLSLPIIRGMAKWLHQSKLWHSGRIQGLLSLFSEQCAKFLQSKFIHREMWVDSVPSQLRQHSNILPIRDISFALKNSFVRWAQGENTRGKRFTPFVSD